MFNFAPDEIVDGGILAFTNITFQCTLMCTYLGFSSGR